MKLVELCEPLILHVCCLNRLARHDGARNQNFTRVREESWDILRKVQFRAAEEGMTDEFRKIRLPLLYFADAMISESALPVAQRWKSEGLARVESRESGDKHFFDLLEQNLMEDPGPDAEDRLEVYYTLLGLGFEGIYKDDAAGHREIMSRVRTRIQDRMDPDEDALMCREAYDSTDRRKLHGSTLGQLGLIALASAFLILVAFAFNGVLYYDKTDLLRQNLGHRPGASLIRAAAAK